MTIELIKKILDNDNLTIKDLENIAVFIAIDINIIERDSKEANSLLSKTFSEDEHMALCELNKLYEQIIHTVQMKETINNN